MKVDRADPRWAASLSTAAGVLVLGWFAFVKGVRVPVVLAGSIDGFPRLEVMKRIRPWAFTIGSAFFDQKFVPGAGFREQMASVLDYLGR